MQFDQTIKITKDSQLTICLVKIDVIGATIDDDDTSIDEGPSAIRLQSS